MKLTILLVCLWLPSTAIAAEFTGKVVSITDGDTIKVMRDGARKIRLSAIGCPEKGQAYGTKAKKATAALCFGKTARVAWNEHDRYGRNAWRRLFNCSQRQGGGRSASFDASLAIMAPGDCA